MLSDMTLGQFFPGDSVLHRLDPRVKIILLLVMIVSLFLFDTPGCYGVMAAFCALAAAASGLPMRTLFRSLKPLWWILLFTFVIHAFNTPGETMASVWIFDMTREGAVRGFFMSLRFALIIFLSSLLTLTTSPLALTDGMEALMRPFAGLGLPAHELAMMTTIALRFVPTLIEETDRIIKAQEARGADFSSGNILRRAQGFAPILIPLFISSFRRADELATAMEARCYRGGSGRTHMKSLQVARLDFFAMGAAAVMIFAMAALKMAGI